MRKTASPCCCKAEYAARERDDGDALGAIAAEGTNGMSKYSELLTEQLKDPALKAEYDALEPEFSAVQAAIDVHKAGDGAKDA